MLEIPKIVNSLINYSLNKVTAMVLLRYREAGLDPNIWIIWMVDLLTHVLAAVNAVTSAHRQLIISPIGSSVAPSYNKIKSKITFPKEYLIFDLTTLATNIVTDLPGELSNKNSQNHFLIAHSVSELDLLGVSFTNCSLIDGIIYIERLPNFSN